jgi:hypothetical protein
MAIALSAVCTEPVAWARQRAPVPSATGKQKPARKKWIWIGLGLAGAGAAVFATAGRNVYQPQQCALVPLATICTKERTVRIYSQAQQGVGVGMVATGGVMVWRGLSR